MPDDLETKEYELTRDDGVVITVQLNAADAKAYGDAVKPASAKSAKAPQNKAVTASNK